ncbi:MAG: hypothetical protein IPG45_33730 [Deltaproteobacteria bacterium]|nr:hypothetical protein [Deltaproteobacteria bacterium]
MSVRFEWASTPPTEQERASLWAHVFVEEGSETEFGRGAILGTAVASLVAETQLTLDKIPNGTNRVFIVEIRNGPDRAASDVRYFGRSESFELAPGQDLEVGVALRLSPTPQIPSSAGLSIIEASADGVVATTAVTLRLVAANATLISVAKDLGFTKGVSQTNAAETRVAEDPSGGSVFEIPGLNLDDGLCTGACPDGLRTVFVQVSNDAGYASAVQSITVRLDRTAPSLIDAAFSPPIARRGTTAFLSLNFDEPVAEAESLELLWEGADPGFRFDRQSGLSQVFSLSVDAALGDPSFLLRGIAVKDRYGNAATLQGDPFPIKFEVDATSIVLSGLAVSPTRVNETGLIEVQVSLDELPQEATVVIGDIVLPADSCQLSGSAPQVLLRCAYAMTGLEVPLGFDVPQPVVVEVADAAGNRSSDGATVSFDFRDPGLTSVVQSYVPSPSSPLPIVDEVAAGTTIVVDAIADELLDPARPPTMWATSASSTLTFTLRTVDGARMRFEAVVGGDYSDGELELMVALTDMAGNEGDVRTGQLVPIRTSTPTLVIQQSQIRFLRSPWGFDAPQQVDGQTLPAGPSFQIVARHGVQPSAPFSFVDGRPMRELRFWSASDRTGGLGRVSTRTSQAWAPISLADVDVPFAFVSGVDAAGNESEPLRVEETLLVATPRALGVRANPNRLTALIRPNPVVSLPTQDGVITVDLGQDPRVLSSDGEALVHSTERLWRRRETTTRPPDRLSAQVVYETGRGRLVVHGGVLQSESGSGVRQDIWVFDGEEFVELYPLQSPSNPAAMIYDPIRGRSLALSKPGGSTPDSLWEFDGANWQQLLPAPTVGLPRSLFDPATGSVLFFSSEPSTPASAQIWVWDGVGFHRALSDANPAVFAGTFRERPFGCGGSPLVTYEWINETWVPVPSGGTPPTTCLGSSAYDPVRDVTVLVNSHGTWEWDGTNWTLAGVNDLIGSSPTVVFDARRRKVLAYTRSVFNHGRLLEWTGSTWIDKTPSSLPVYPPTYRVVAQFHPQSGQHLLLADCDPSPCSTLWAWNGIGWRSVAPPTGVVAAAGLLAYDPSTERVLIVDDATGRLYGWDGLMWTPLTNSTFPPLFLQSPTSARRMAFDEARGVLVVAWSEPSFSFIPVPLHVTEWRSAGWVDVSSDLMPCAGSLGPRSCNLRDFGLAYDASSGYVVIDGGGSPVTHTGATYAWSGSEWSTLSNPSYSILNASLVWDSDRSRLVRFGGRPGDSQVCAQGGGVVCSDLREFVNGAFTLVGTRRQVPRSSHAASYDTVANHMFVFGGVTSQDFESFNSSADVFELYSESSRRPAMQFDLDLRAAGVARDGVDAISVTAFGAGQGTPFDEVSGQGASLQAWVPFPFAGVAGPGWVTVGENLAAINSPPAEVGPGGILTWSAPTSTEARAVVSDSAVHFQVVTREGSGVDVQEREARLALDAIWAEVLYH